VATLDACAPNTVVLTTLSDRLKAGRQPLLDHPERVRALLAQIQKQRAAVEAAGAGCPAILARLDGPGRRLFESSFFAQHSILLGLLAWLEQGLLAGLSLQGQDEATALAHLVFAQRAFRLIRAGQALASCGDRKMNLGGAEKLTEQLIQQLAAQRRQQAPPATTIRPIRRWPEDEAPAMLWGHPGTLCPAPSGAVDGSPRRKPWDWGVPCAQPLQERQKPTEGRSATSVTRLFRP